ncbi:polysaccharide pyruvyl transferase family protein [Peribacillus muralis]|uniref:polysaccharide pyruvyl transferase family protein n=1 Tax=Peribacillus muralis TaxID=264697 RepID=UPI001F4E0299|nr:polysaccharide pyruvyl transferase family protein [Peribacillus muralis]MCK1991634.1 polysaccharide pyruvyl transferase family protein [Peribacillus muralis]MCK2012193.1 polysaccharide pyruvyl transferase family protein [Peribacillus muralis]
MKKNLLVKAYLKENLGDDLFLKLLFERYPNKIWYLLDSNESYCKPFENLKNVKTITFKEFLTRFWRFDGFINIGGSIFQQQGKKLGIKKNLIITTILNLSKKKSFMLGANFGPYKTSLYKKAYDFYFKNVADVCFRDKKSFNLFKNNNKVRIAPDIVFGLEKNEVEKINNSIGISIIDLSNRPELKAFEDVYIKKMAELITDLSNKGKKIHLLSFCKEEGDEEAINKILSTLKKSINEKIELNFYKGNINEYLDKLQKIESIIACRFHSLILAQVYSQPVFPIIYSNKTMSVLEDLNLNIYYSYIKDLEDLNCEMVYEALLTNKMGISDIACESNMHFYNLDKYLLED